MPVTLNGDAGVTTNTGAVYNGLQTGTAVASTSGTSIDFTGIPSWVKRITVMFNGVSTNGTSVVQVQLGTSSGVEVTGYLGSSSATGSGVGTSLYTAGLGINFGGNNVAASVRNGSVIFSNLTGNTWAAFGVITLSDAAVSSITSTSKTLSGTLDRIRITTVNGTDTFDAGSINIIYE